MLKEEKVKGITCKVRPVNHKASQDGGTAVPRHSDSDSL